MTTKPSSGFRYFPNANLPVIQILDQTTQTSEIIFEPTMDDLKNLCDKWDLDYEKTWQIVNARDRGAVHTIIFALPEFREYLKTI